MLDNNLSAGMASVMGDSHMNMSKTLKNIKDSDLSKTEKKAATDTAMKLNFHPSSVGIGSGTKAFTKAMSDTKTFKGDFRKRELTVVNLIKKKARDESIASKKQEEKAKLEAKAEAEEGESKEHKENRIDEMNRTRQAEVFNKQQSNVAKGQYGIDTSTQHAKVSAHQMEEGKTQAQVSVGSSDHSGGAPDLMID